MLNIRIESTCNALYWQQIFETIFFYWFIDFPFWIEDFSTLPILKWNWGARHIFSSQYSTHEPSEWIWMSIISYELWKWTKTNSNLSKVNWAIIAKSSSMKVVNLFDFMNARQFSHHFIVCTGAESMLERLRTSRTHKTHLPCRMYCRWRHILPTARYYLLFYYFICNFLVLRSTSFQSTSMVKRAAHIKIFEKK